MSALIEEILAAEAEGRRLVAAARDRAAEIISEAGRQAAALAAAARERNRLEAERLSASLLEGAAREKATQLAAAKAGIERSLHLEEAELNRLADKIVKRVSETD